MGLSQFLFFILYLFISFSLKAQQATVSDYYVQHFTDENGLPQNSIKAIVKDNRGFVWLATEDGLVRFDGQRFYTFNKNQIAVSSNRIHGFLPAIDHYNVHNKEFHALTEGTKYIRVLPDGCAVLDSAYHNKLLANAPYARETKGDIYILGSHLIPYSASSGSPHLVLSGDNNFYTWTTDKIEYYHKRSKEGAVLLKSKSFFLLNTHPYAILANGHFVKISLNAQSELIKVDGDITRDAGYAVQKTNYRLLWDNISQKAYLYLNQRLYTLKESQNQRTLTTQLVVDGFDFDKLKIKTAYYDEDLGHLFLGSITKGLYVLTPNRFKTVKASSKDADNIFYSQLIDSKNSVITAQGYALGLQDKLLKRKNSDVSSLMKNMDLKYFMAPDRDSSFWMGMYLDLFKFDKTGKKILTHLALKENFKAMFMDKQKRLWLGGFNGELFTINSDDPSNTVHTAARSAIGEITCIEQESSDVLLLGTYKGLYRFYVKSARLEFIRGLENTYIRSLYPSHDGTWITTYGNGLFLLSKGKVTHFPLDKDQFLATSHCMIEDSKGYFWITTNKGLFQASKKDLLNFAAGKQSEVFYLYYDKRHGFEINEFNGGCQPCGLKLPNGYVSLPSMDGLVWFSPDQIKPELPVDDIFINQIELNEKRITPKDLTALPRKFEQLRLHLSTPYYADAKNIQMSYTVKRDDQDPVWLPVPDDFVIPFSNASSGNYVLTIRKMNGFGPNNYSYKSIKLSVSPGWYETWWFRAVVLISILILFLLVLIFRTKYVIDRERDRAMRRHYRIYSQIVVAINHDIQTPLHYLTSSFKHVHSFLHGQTHNKEFTMQVSDQILNTTIRLDALTKNLLNYIKAQSEDKIAGLQIGLVNVHDLARQTCLLFEGAANFSEIHISNQVDNNFTVHTDSKLLSVIIHNLVDNAVKASTSQVIIASAVVKDQKQIGISDTGNGMPLEIMEWLNKPHKSYDEWTRTSDALSRKGVGLFIVKDLCELLGMRVAAEHTSDSGTTIQIIFKQRRKSVNRKSLNGFLPNF